jgi:hypothetical protein
MMNPIWKMRLVMSASTVLALAVGWWIANGDYLLPRFLVLAAGAACLVALLRVSFDVVVLGGLLVGYIVGNRGFAQFSFVSGLPLLPAEVGLALCLLWLAVRAVFTKRLPLRRDAVNIAVAAWIVVGAARILPDVRAHGAIALRDFAMTYYALFFFVAQAQAADGRARRFLERCLLAATVVIIPIFAAFGRFPEFFLNTLNVGGTPLIFLKGDLVATFMAAGVLLTHRRFERTRRWWWLATALLGVVGVVASENRASLVALGVVTLWLALDGRWRLLWAQLAGAAAAGLLLLAGAVTGWVDPRDNAALRAYERAASVVDVAGDRAYRSADVAFKGDNNRYRLVWWQAVIDETVETNPWLGLGFGYDLATEFVRRYYPDSTEDFSARSPHSIVVSAFGRTGVLGAGALLAIVAAMAWRTQRALRAPGQADVATLWLVAWAIFVSACFGVVLEGPMGAVVFWTVLGLANAAGGTTEAAEEGVANTDAPAAKGGAGAPPPEPEAALPSAGGSA